MMIVQNAKLNLIPGAVLPRINVTQYDYGSRSLKFEIWNGSQRFTLANGMTARVQGTKPDRFGFDYDATVDVSNNLVVCNLTQQMTAAYGDCVCEIVLLKTGERIGTLNFVLDIQPAGINDDTVISDSELPDIIAQATEQMENAEAWAVGTKNGEPVPSTDEQYHHNAKYYAESISGFSNDSEAWAVGERDGVPVTSEDETYHNNSKYYSNQAGTQATTATTQALKSEGFAVGKQNDTAVGSGSPYYQNNSKYYSEQAAASASEAAAWSSNPPYIGANGNWWIYNTTTSQFEDSGIDASITVDIEDITMLEPTATPYVTNTGTDTDPEFHLFIPRGKGIASISKTSTSGLVDTYTITYSDNATTTFTVTNGNGISAISKTSTSGLVDTYTISYTNGTSTTYTVTNGKTAYQSAVEGGYPGTEQEFDDALGSFETLAQSATTSAQNALASAQAAAGSATTAHQEYLDAKAEADRAQLYADFIEPHFIIQNNRLYIKDDAVGEFIVANNRLYIKFVA